MGVLAIDPGTRKCGFAYTDRARILTTALDVLRFEGDRGRLLDHLEALLEERDVGTLLVGIPLDGDGADTEQAGRSRELVAVLRERYPTLRVLTYDEHGTTKEAEARLRELGHNGGSIRERKDSWAALVLLEDWLANGEPGSA